MRLVRIDGLTSGGRALELHPRLTVLLGAPTEVRALLGAAFGALVDGSPPPVGGLVEVDGVRSDLDRGSLDLLGTSAPVDNVLDLDTPAPLRPVPSRRADDAPTGAVGQPPAVELHSVAPDAAAPGLPGASGLPGVADRQDPADPARTTRALAERELAELRVELRAVTGERTVLARRMDEARAGLDSFARATLDVALGQLEAVEERRAAAVEEHEGWTAAVAERRAELVARLDDLRSEQARLEVLDPTSVREASERLAALLDPPTEPDPAARALAHRLEDLVRSAEELEARRDEASGHLAAAEAELAEALQAARAAQETYRSSAADPEVVRQLERVRDEIFDIEERGGRLAAARSKRRIEELRAEEAELLDRLGFDTYSSYVMGVPTARAEAQRAMQLDAVQSRVEDLRRDADRLRADAPGGSEDQWHDEERRSIVEEAAALLGTPADALGRLTSGELTELLRDRVLPPPPETSAEILSAAGWLASTMTAAGAPTPTAAVAPRAMLVMAEDWLDGIGDRERRLDDLGDLVEDAQQELARLDAEVRRSDDGGRSADLDAELLAVRERVEEAEDRVDRHLAATSELAELRTQELDLRDRERDLLARVADRERLLTVLGSEVPPPPAWSGTTPIGAASHLPEPVLPEPVLPESGLRAVEGATGGGGEVATLPVDREWRLLSRLGDVRSVGEAGAVPLLVTGVDAAAPDTAALLHRMHVMSELVQLLLVTDDERVARWAEGLGADASVVRW
jgi:hypothetical protein